MSNRNPYSFQNLFISTLFVTIITLPIIGAVFNIRLIELSENRAKASMPSLSTEWAAIKTTPADLSTWGQFATSIARYPKAFESYFDDNFAFRDSLIRLHSYLVIHGLPSSSDALIGKDNWLFYGEPQALASYRRTDRFTTEELENWRLEIEANRDWLAERGIKYLFVIAPEKSTIYPEYMPEYITRAASQSRLDQFVSYMEQSSDVEIVDLRDELLKHKHEEILYFRTDTHWNDLGAYIAYQAIIHRLTKWFPQLAPTPAADFSIEVQPFSGDLAGILALNDVLIEDAPFMTMRAERRSHLSPPGLGPFLDISEWQQPMATEVDDSVLPKAIVFRDSFGERLSPFLAEDFRRVLTISDYSLYQETIIREQPDVVIQEMVERILYFSEPPGDALQK